MGKIWDWVRESPRFEIIYILSVISVIILVVYSFAGQVEAKTEYLDMTCLETADKQFKRGWIYRCENSEVVCYTVHVHKGSGINCKFK